MAFLGGISVEYRLRVVTLPSQTDTPSFAPIHQSSYDTTMAQIQVRQRDGVVLLDISGTLSGAAGVLHEEVGKALANGSRGVVLNLQDASYFPPQN